MYHYDIKIYIIKYYYCLKTQTLHIYVTFAYFCTVSHILIFHLFLHF